MDKLVSKLHCHSLKLALIAGLLINSVWSGYTVAAEVLHFGVIPIKRASTTYEMFLPLTVYLSRELGIEVKLKIGKNYETTIDDLGKDVTQVAYLGPAGYAEASAKYSIEAIVKPLLKGRPFYTSIIITKEGSGIRSVADIKGKKFAFGSIKSTSSHLMPRSILAAEGITLSDLSKYSYTGSHSNVAKSVLVGIFDAGGIMKSVAEEFKDKGLVYLKESNPIPEFPVVVKKSMDPNLKAKLIKALLALKDPAVIGKINKKFTGFTRAADADYNVIRSMQKNLK